MALSRDASRRHPAEQVRAWLRRPSSEAPHTRQRLMPPSGGGTLAASSTSPGGHPMHNRIALAAALSIALSMAACGAARGSLARRAWLGSLRRSARRRVGYREAAPLLQRRRPERPCP